MLSRRGFIRLAGGTAAAATALAASGIAHAEVQAADATWIANHLDTRLIGADGQPVVGLPRWTRMRILRSFPNGQLQVWVPRFDLVGKVLANAIGPVPAPASDELDLERFEGPPLY